ncbi:MAG: DNA ligase D [Deltaproteobacteria bacterium]|nr:MAG: DNA ligase D [Deltaproteobacteria bacterium]
MAGRIPAQAVGRSHPGADGRGSSAARRFCRAKTQRFAHALRPATRVGRRAQVLGGAARSASGSGREKAGNADRGSPGRVRGLRGGHSGRGIRRWSHDRLGPRAVASGRRPARGSQGRQAALRAEGLQAEGDVDVGSDQGRDGKGVVADQGDRRRARAPRRRRALRRLFHPFRSRGRGAARARQAGGGDARALRGAEGPAAPGGWGGRAADAGRAAQRPVRRPRHDGARPRIFYRRGADATAVFPDLARALLALPAERFIADGEIAVLDDTGRPVFQRLQKRALLTAPRDVERAAAELPATLFLFDLLAFEDFDLRTLPLIERKKLLLQLVPAAGPIRAVDYVEGQGRALYASVRELGLEGIVAKRAQSAYRSGRFRDWQKIRIDRVGDFAVVGFTRAEGSRTGFGSVHVAVQNTEGLVYVGKVGGGFSEKELTSARAELEALRLDKPPCMGPLPGGRGHTWVQPKLVVEVRYKEITEDGLLRQPTFLRFRSDKAPAECIEPGAPPVTLLPREVPFSNLDKVFWPEDGYTKGDLIDYYRAVSPWLLPYLRDRPVVLTRYPDGIAGKSFFQKDAPDYVPAWVRTARVWSEEGGRDIDFFVCEDVDTLLYVINLGTIPLHLWASRMAKPQHPDWSIIDLDPKTAPFEDVVTLANAVHELCEEIGLPSFCKTSGQKGLHVLLPVGGQLTHAQSTTLAELIARAVESRFPRIATIERHIPSRKGRVYLDYLQNGHGKTIAGPFSARPVQGATVSMPLKWSEVNGKLDPRKFTLKTAPARMKKLRQDPLQPVLELSPDLQAALARLAGKLR